ncbi:MAG: hypothetical protein K1X72_11670 [Pyrinomonadaceae bacterium]|nr:hypothetical protein [Pyrinomonadaceae bacterium]
MKKLVLSLAISVCVLAFSAFGVSAQGQFKIVATNKTSTAEKEMNQAAAAGFRFEGVSGGETAFGGKETVIVMSNDGNSGGRFQYKLLATQRTSTMQKELNEAGNNGFEYRGQTVFETTFGGQEVVVILEKDTQMIKRTFEYKLLATSKTSTMQKELNEVGGGNFVFAGITTGQTAFGGKELVVVLKREVTQR